ncbi:NAD(P)/FAD-dependent oxidoreductase [Microaerobacter geothermalis]|uniref:NAD(P)/FAD-dependent oxidoreductase n=1 Tax=Microaerobacter geothermalis TaxID=674972 RepID=UPI001F304024|nr:NAD(P)/FAD-dependent oxidoreductase [Microaerobacter geothermalis]MCF6094935.1 NAD(P)/FAD-dependent oxidoreductase [Microaerobacter geothermalis]
MNVDVIVIGGGPSGLMASIAAGSHGARVLLVEKGGQLGRKLAISGGGRCNVTNAGDLNFIVKNIPGNGRFLYSALSQFNNWDIIAFFEDLGIQLKEEDRGRMFPVSDKAKDVVNALVKKVVETGAEIRKFSPVEKVLYDHDSKKVKGILLKSGEKIFSDHVIISVGGMSVPHTGSTGDGYAWAREAGHTITELYPTEVPIISDEDFIQDRSLQGLSLRDVELTVWDPKEKRIIRHEGDMLFTHFGLSGPISLRCSSFVVKGLKKYGVSKLLMTIDLIPAKNTEEIELDIYHLAEEHHKKIVKNVLKGYLPDRLIPILLQKAGLEDDLTFLHIPKEKWHHLAKLVKAFPVHVNGTLSIEEAFVTGGGVNLKEIDPKTMHSKIMEGLAFSGEILDIQGYTGGFNLTAAMVTGYVAGKSAAEESKKKQRI